MRGGGCTLAAPLATRVDLMAVTLKAILHPILKRDFHQFVGSWVYVVGFRKEALSIIQECYIHLHSWPDGGGVKMLPSKVVEELLMLTFMSPLLVCYLKDQPVRGQHLDSKLSRDEVAVFATDAAGDGGIGGCMAFTDVGFWKQCFGCSEDLGEYTRLDWGTDEPVETSMIDRRAETAHFCGALDWREMFDYKAKPSSSSGVVAHINVLECQGLLYLLR